MNISILKYYEYAVFKNQLAKGDEVQLIKLLASVCCRIGIKQEHLLAFSFGRFALSRRVLKKEVFAAYHIYDYKLRAVEMKVKKLPCFSSNLFKELPKLLKDGEEKFESQREKDVYVFSALTVLSTCFPKVVGSFRKQSYYGNLFSYFISPLSMNVGVLDYASLLGHEYQSELDQNNNLEVLKYSLAQSSHLAKAGTKESSATLSLEEKVKVSKLFLPKEVNEDSLSYHLSKDAYNRGLIVNQQLEKFGESLNHQWSGFTAQMKKAFDHKSLKFWESADELVEITNPKLSVVMSGGLQTLLQMVPVIEDGLYSRFCFYACPNVPNRYNNKDFDLAFLNLSKRVKTMIKYCSTRPVQFRLSQGQENCMQASFRLSLSKLSFGYGKDLLPLVKRNAIHQFRIAMLLTLLMNYEDGNWKREMVCTPVAFNIAQDIAEVLLEHALVLYPLFESN